MAALLLGCGPPPAPASYERPEVERPDEAEASARRGACSYERGTWPGESLGAGVPIGESMPIDHILVLMLENRSYDHYFSDDLPLGSYTGPSPNHSWIGTHVALLRGYSEAARVRLEMPYYRELYGRFASSDAHFAGLPGPTWPNRYMLLSGTSFGMVENGVAHSSRMKDGGSIFSQLDRARVPWRVYFADLPFVMGAFPSYAAQHMAQFGPIPDLFDALKSGELPGFAFIEPSYIGPRRTDEHAPADPRQGQAFTRSIVEALMASPAWERTALFITYDEGGGFYDSAVPPMGCDPGDWPVPEGMPGSFAERGVRVPLVVVSPWARMGHVSHRVTGATSILRFIQARFDLPALTGRDANAWPLLDLFDFSESDAGERPSPRLPSGGRP